MNKIMVTIIGVIIALCLLRGIFVFDMGASSIYTNTTASAVCLVGGLFGLMGMMILKDEAKKKKK